MSVELVNPDIDRVDAVNGPATGIPFLMFKSAEAPAAVVAKAADDAEDVAEEVAEAEAPNVDGAAVSDEAIAAAEPGDPAWEAVDAAKARVAVSGLAVLRKLVAELGQREDAEESYSADAFDLMDAGAALDFALGVLARFSVTEQLEADDAAELASTRAAGLLKALHLEVHEKPDEADAPAVAETPVDDALVAPEGHEPEASPVTPDEAIPAVSKAKDGVLPSGLMELLSTFVEGYSHYMEAKASGAEEELSAEDAAAAPAKAPAPAAPAPAEVATVPEAPAAHEAPAEPEHAPTEAPAHPAPTHAPAEAAPADAPKDEEDPAEKFKKSMQDAISEAVAAATAPLLKQIDALERTPVDSGPLLAGQIPGMAGTPLVRGQEEGAVTKGLGNGFVPAQAAPGNNPLAEGLKSLYKSMR